MFLHAAQKKIQFTSRKWTADKTSFSKKIWSNGETIFKRICMFTLNLITSFYVHSVDAIYIEKLCGFTPRSVFLDSPSSAKSSVGVIVTSSEEGDWTRTEEFFFTGVIHARTQVRC